MSEAINLNNKLKDNNKKSVKFCINIGKILDKLKKAEHMKDKDFDKVFKNESGFSKTNRNFFIQFYDLASKHPKVKTITVSYTCIQRNFKVLVKCILQDEEFWQQTIELYVDDYYLVNISSYSYS